MSLELSSHIIQAVIAPTVYINKHTAWGSDLHHCAGCQSYQHWFTQVCKQAQLSWLQQGEQSMTLDTYVSMAYLTANVAVYDQHPSSCRRHLLIIILSLITRSSLSQLPCTQLVSYTVVKQVNIMQVPGHCPDHPALLDQGPCTRISASPLASI